METANKYPEPKCRNKLAEKRPNQTLESMKKLFRVKSIYLGIIFDQSRIDKREIEFRIIQAKRVLTEGFFVFPNRIEIISYVLLRSIRNSRLECN